MTISRNLRRSFFAKKVKKEMREKRCDILDEFNDAETRALIQSGRRAIREGAEGIPVFPPAKKVTAKRK